MVLLPDKEYILAVSYDWRLLYASRTTYIYICVCVFVCMYACMHACMYILKKLMHTLLKLSECVWTILLNFLFPNFLHTVAFCKLKTHLIDVQWIEIEINHYKCLLESDLFLIISQNLYLHHVSFLLFLFDCTYMLSLQTTATFTMWFSLLVFKKKVPLGFYKISPWTVNLTPSLYKIVNNYWH